MFSEEPPEAITSVGEVIVPASLFTPTQTRISVPTTILKPDPVVAGKNSVFTEFMYDWI